MKSAISGNNFHASFAQTKFTAYFISVHLSHKYRLIEGILSQFSFISRRPPFLLDLDHLLVSNILDYKENLVRLALGAGWKL